MIKTTAIEVIGKKLIVCNRAVKWWDEKVKKALRVRIEPHARYPSLKTTAGWEHAIVERA